MIFMSPALSMKAPPLIWNPEAEVKSGMREAEESERHVTRQEAVVRQCSTAAELRPKCGAYLTGSFKLFPLESDII
jgi:hypothetical protein